MSDEVLKLKPMFRECPLCGSKQISFLPEHRIFDPKMNPYADEYYLSGHAEIKCDNCYLTLDLGWNENCETYSSALAKNAKYIDDVVNRWNKRWTDE